MGEREKERLGGGVSGGEPSKERAPQWAEVH